MNDTIVITGPRDGIAADPESLIQLLNARSVDGKPIGEIEFAQIDRVARSIAKGQTSLRVEPLAKDDAASLMERLEELNFGAQLIVGTAPPAATHLAVGQRSMTASERELFLRTGQRPDLTRPLQPSDSDTGSRSAPAAHGAKPATDKSKVEERFNAWSEPVKLFAVMGTTLAVVGMTLIALMIADSGGTDSPDTDAETVLSTSPAAESATEVQEAFRRYVEGFGLPIESWSDAESACMVAAASSPFSQDQSMVMLGYE